MNTNMSSPYDKAPAAQSPLPDQGEAGERFARRVRASSLLTLSSALLLVAITTLPGAPVFAQTTPTTAPSPNRIEAVATNLHSSAGSFSCQLYNSAKGFPKTDESVVAGSRVKIHDGQAACVFNNQPPGDYAVVAMHDEDDSGKMEYNFIGIPTKGYGFSSGATATFGAPSFDAAKFTYTGGVLKVPIPLHY
jgi:uncharacterized protein (DUF2141 family)